MKQIAAYIFEKIKDLPNSVKGLIVFDIDDTILKVDPSQISIYKKEPGKDEITLSTDEFATFEKHKQCYFNYTERKSLLEAMRYVDLVIPEDSWNQKLEDCKQYHIDTFVMGDDWKGKFDYLQEEGIEVIYLPRTPEISTTRIKSDLGE